MDTMHCSNISSQRGFTLIELMVAVAVLSILLGLGVPAFTDTIRNNQIAAAGGDLVGALTLARNEALKRSVQVSVCAAADQDTCAAGTDWSNGWIVFVDDTGAPGVIDVGDTPLQNWSAPARGVSVISAIDAAISFTPRARARSAQQFSITKVGCSGSQRRLIDLSRAGRIGITRQECD